MLVSQIVRERLRMREELKFLLLLESCKGDHDCTMRLPWGCQEPWESRLAFSVGAALAAADLQVLLA